MCVPLKIATEIDLAMAYSGLSICGALPTGLGSLDTKIASHSFTNGDEIKPTASMKNKAYRAKAIGNVLYERLRNKKYKPIVISNAIGEKIQKKIGSALAFSEWLMKAHKKQVEYDKKHNIKRNPEDTKLCCTQLTFEDGKIVEKEIGIEGLIDYLKNKEEISNEQQL